MLSIFSIFLHPKDTAELSPDQRARIGQSCGLIGILANLLLFGAKLAVGTLSGSVSITADAMNNLSDASASIVTFLGFRLARKPADEHHPYGHARVEYLSGLAVAVLILFIGFELSKTSLGKILNPQPVAFSWTLAAVLVGSIVVKLGLAVFNSSLGKRIHSQALLATAADSRNDCVATTVVLLSAAFEAFWGLRIDGWAGLAVGVFILWSGWNMARDTVSPLLGESADPELVRLIVRELGADDRILGWHDLMVHDYGPSHRFATVHVEMDTRYDPLLCHTIIDNIERTCLHRHQIHLVIHYDPVVTDDAEANAAKARLTEILAAIDSRIRFHDFRLVRGEGSSNLIFDLILPKDLEPNRAQIKTAIDESLNDGAARRLHTVITFESPAFNHTDLF